jgi:hypothetical protein
VPLRGVADVLGLPQDVAAAWLLQVGMPIHLIEGEL